MTSKSVIPAVAKRRTGIHNPLIKMDSRPRENDGEPVLGGFRRTCSQQPARIGEDRWPFKLTTGADVSFNIDTMVLTRQICCSLSVAAVSTAQERSRML